MKNPLKKPSRIKISRVQVNLTPCEYSEVKKAAQRENETVPNFFRNVFFDSIDKRSASKSQKNQFENLEGRLDFIVARLSKIERVLRILVVNTAIARGHAAGVLELSNQSDHDVLHKRMLEAREQQKQTFFELFPELRETNT